MLARVGEIFRATECSLGANEGWNGTSCTLNDIRIVSFAARPRRSFIDQNKARTHLGIGSVISDVDTPTRLGYLFAGIQRAGEENRKRCRNSGCPQVHLILVKSARFDKNSRTPLNEQLPGNKVQFTKNFRSIEKLFLPESFAVPSTRAVGAVRIMLASYNVTERTRDIVILKARVTHSVYRLHYRSKRCYYLRPRRRLVYRSCRLWIPNVGLIFGLVWVGIGPRR